MCGQIKRCASLSVFFIVLLYLGGSPAWAKEFSKHKVQINGIVIDVKGKEPAVPEILEPRVDKGRRKWVVQFTGPIHEEEKAKVEELGCRLLDYLPDFAFLATMDDTAKKAVKKLPYIEGVVRFKPAHKLREKLREKATARPSGEKIRIHLRLDDPANVRDVLAVVQQMEGDVLDVGRDTLRVAVDTTSIAKLAAIEEVSWIDEHFDMQLFNDTTRWVIQTDIPDNTEIWDQKIHGEGQIIGIGDTGLDYDMPWFRDPAGAPIGTGHRKIVGYDTTYGDDYDASTPGHGTHVTDTVAGDRTPVDGLSNANGMAPKARVFIQDLTPGGSNAVYPPDDLGLMFTAAYNVGARFHTNSWGNDDGSYSSFAASADRFLWEHKEFLALFANGNAGPGLSTVGNPATAKNVISVGATYNGSSAENMASFSSNGPTADGRIKPTVTAPGYGIISADSDGLKDSSNNGTLGMSGTSMATPAVAGAAALVRQYFIDGFHPLGIATPINAFTPSAALVKAVVVNSAQNMTGTGTGGPIPATGQGWGRINLANALPFAGEAGRLAVVDEGGGLGTDKNWSRQFLVPGGQPFKVTLVWTDYPGTIGAVKAIVNDLDLAVSTPDGTVLTGNAFTNGESFAGGTPDRLNVEEQVLVQAPVPGIYTVSVTGYNVPYAPQPFALAITGASGVTSRGTISLDRQRYNSSSTLQIQIADRDLNSDPTKVEQVPILVVSTAESSGETVVLTESAPNIAIFSGSIPIAAAPVVPGDGRLQGADGDTITAIYHDANDGSGKSATVTAAAFVDNVPPAISNLAVTGITDTAATITWTTNEPANSVLNYGDTPAMGGVSADKKLATEHSMRLTALLEAATYHVAAKSTDEAGNTAGSSAILFTTLNLPPSLTVTSSEGSTTYQPSTVITGVCTDPSGVSSVTINGTVANYRPSDGYYSLPVALQVGDNGFTVAATDTLGKTTSLTITVTRLQPSDLFVQSVAGPPSAVQGSTITITDTVCNGGPGDATGFSVGFYLSSDQNLSSDDMLIGSRNVASIAAGTCPSGTTRAPIPPTAPGGSLYLIACADYTNRLVETNKNNNTLAGNQITLPNPQLAPPSSINVPAGNTTGSFQVSWSPSNVSGVTYVLEYSKDNGAYTSAYNGTYTWANLTVPASGTYTFRVKAAKTGYTDSAYSATRSCSVTLICGAPASISVPSGNTTGSFQVSWSPSNVSGVTYVLEYSKDNGAYTSAYNGTYTWANLTVPASGTYTFRVKAAKTGYTDSAYSATKSCSVTLICGAPASISVPSGNTTGSFQVSWSPSNVSGVTYVLEYSKDNGAYTSAYKGTYTWANLTVPASGTYTFRVKAAKTGYTDSAYSATKSCSVILICGAPASISVPSGNTTGSFQVSWSPSNVSGVTYVLEYSKDNGAYTSAYNGTYTWANLTVPASGTYTFRVKAAKTGYTDSAYSATKSCSVTLICGAPASISVPSGNTTGSFQVSWSPSNVSGVTYVLEYSKDNGAYTSAYSGTYTWANLTVPASGTYTFRVKAAKTGYTDSAYSATKSCSVTLICGAPASISVPSGNTTGSFQVSWSPSNVSGVTYVLEYSKDNGAYTSAYKGTYTWANLTVPASGTYTFRVKAAKTGYTDSAYSATKSCSVTLICGAPASISVPASSTTGSFQVSWSRSNVSGVTYVLEYSKDNGAYTSAFRGPYTWANLTVPARGTYTFRVKATKTGYADSAWKVSSSIVVNRK
ncbi:S8 family serine peptidase [Geotalea uraniireducens]|uniref:Peptidase S8 and S53, subtilisin, kexin, sedolisin n=1 Tax=Geotalea uraniireducens (strain Rf4) TaxID=351605 RepID=A5GCU9_GEOUR|nr:S8 family serine peptidase [Geotalea uraniireducens]ABQ24599.1 peptidase S8 and S53, subtilisin, kexin, sedolisin [Geotalea uraniireducens Rf4]